MAKVPAAGGYAYGAYNPYTHAPAEGQDYETAAGTPLYLPEGAEIVSTGSNGALGNFAIVHADGKYFWFGHLDSIDKGAVPGAQFATTGSPETAGGYGHGAHLWFAVSKTQDLSTNEDPRPYIGTQGLWSPSGAGVTVHVGQQTTPTTGSKDPLENFFSQLNESTGANLPIPNADIWSGEAPDLPEEKSVTEAATPPEAAATPKGA